jgi:flagellar motor switch protein FliN/FliY
MPETTEELRRYLAEGWTAALVQILESMTDQKPNVGWSAAAAPEGEEAFWWEQSLNLEEAPLVWVGAPEATWSELGGRTLRAAGIDAVEPADAKNTYLEILNQSLSGLAQSITERMGSEVTCVKGAECAAPQAGAEWVSVEISYDTALRVWIGFSPALIARMGQPADRGTASKPQDVAAADAHEPENEPAHSEVGRSRTLDLLMDVELPVSVSFGRAELLLRDILKLTTGSIVELNRGISEPVEVIVNNCVVARGEVVVMDGNYGVRIHQIISPQERLRTLK